VNTSVESGPAVPDAITAPAMLPPPEETMTARMLKGLPVASEKVLLFLSRYRKHRHPKILLPDDPAASIQNAVPEGSGCLHDHGHDDPRCGGRPGMYYRAAGSLDPARR